MAAKGNWPTLLSPPVMLGTLLAAGLAGVVAGFYPACAHPASTRSRPSASSEPWEVEAESRERALQ